MEWWQILFLIVGAVIYVVLTGVTFAACAKTIGDLMKDVRHRSAAADRLDKNIARLTTETAFKTSQIARRDACRGEAKTYTLQARGLYVVMWTAFLWPIWLVVFLIAAIIGTLVAKGREIKGTKV